MTLDLPSEARKVNDAWHEGYGACPHMAHVRVLECDQCLSDLILAFAEKVREEALAEGKALGRAEVNSVYASMKSAEVPHE